MRNNKLTEEKKLKLFTPNVTNDPLRDLAKAMDLLRRFYDVVEMSHLTDHKLINDYCESFKIRRSLGEDVFNFLQAKDEVFRKTVIKRQRRYERFQEKKCQLIIKANSQHERN